MTAEDHKKLGIELFNATWDLIDQPDRTEAEAFTMIHAAHASAYHWLMAGGSVLNQARSQWQISRVYAILGMGESALKHGQRSLDLCLANNVGDFDLAFGYEAAARAFAVLGNDSAKAENKSAALAACQAIAKTEDRIYAEGEINSIA